MPAKTNFNVGPYWDDYNKEDDFYRVLFRPGFAVQARELTTLQSILQNQIEQFGNHMFKEGTIVIPGSVAYDSKYYSLKLQSTFGSGTVSSYLSQYNGAIITGATSGVTAKVIGYSVADSTTGDPDTLFIKYQGTGTDNSSVTFTDGESISANKAISSYATNVISATTAVSSANGTGSAVKVLAGVYFVRGFMVQNTEQTVVLDKYSNTTSYRVGWLITETLVSPETDSSLLDNAQGSSNYAAKGAHRLKISLTLTKRSLDSSDDENFIELVRVKNGFVERQVKGTEYSVIADMIARRTNDESGDYIVKHFDIEAREHLDTGTNRGIYTAANGGDESKVALSISPGKAYVDGYEIELQSPSIVPFNKSRTFESLNNDSVPAFLGNYVEVDNVYGQPDISKVSTTLDPFKIVKLYDTETATPGSASGTLVGYARSRAFEHNSGTVGTATAVYHHYLFDITMFNKLVMGANVASLTANAVITGATSGATAVVVAAITNSTDVWVMQQKGEFSSGESITSSVSGDDTSTNSPTVAAGTFLAENKKNFARDVKQIFMATTGTINYTADTVLSTSTQLGGNIDADGVTTTIVGYNTSFTQDLVVGDIVTMATGASGALEEFAVSTITNDRTIVLGGTPANAVEKIAINRIRTGIKQIEETALLYRMPKDNVKTLLDSLGASDTTYDYRIQKTGTTNGSSAVTFTLPAGNTWASPSTSRNYVLTITSAGTGTGAAGDVVSITSTGVVSGGTQLTVTDAVVLGSGASVVLMGTATLGTATHKSKTAQVMTTKQIQSYTGGGTYQDVYGERLSDAEISLSYADVYKLHAVYESTSNATDAVAPTLTTVSPTGTFTIGELITGSVTGAIGRVISDSANTVTYVKVTGTFTALDVITGGTSGNTASISATTTGDKNITSSFVLDSGQRPSFYDVGRIQRKPEAQAPSGRLLIVYDYFSHGSGDYFSVDSYTGQIPYGEIPDFSTVTPDVESIVATGEYSLRDVLDFRPRVQNHTAPTATPFSFDVKDFESTGAVAGNIVVPDDNIRVDFDCYLGRKDLLYLSKEGEWIIVEGVPSQTPTFPAVDNANMLVGRIEIPEYTFSVEDITLSYMNNKGYTMKDISRLETRIANLEYSTTLALLEKETESFNISDADGLSRFKSGFIVDNFYGHGVGNSQHKDYGVSVDPEQGHLRPIGIQTGVNLIEEATTDSVRTGLGYKRSGDIITLSYSEVQEMSQPYASRVESVNPYFVTQWVGNMKLEPDSDIWMDDDRVPAVTVNVEGNYEQMLRETKESGALGTVWNSWNTVWSGNRRSSSSTGIQRNPNGSGSQRNLIRRVTTETTSVDVRQRRTGTNTRLVERIDNVSTGDRVTNVEVVPWMRSRDVDFTVTGMKPKTRVYAFFDGVNVTADVKPIFTSAKSTTLTSNLSKAATTITVASTADFPSSGTLGIGDVGIGDPFGVGRLKQEQVTYTGKTATTFTGVSRNVGNVYDEPQNWLSTTPVTNGSFGNALVTDDVGTLYGRFRIPNTTEKRFRVGQRVFRLTDSATDDRRGGFVYTSAEKEYMAVGHKQTKQELIMATRNAEVVRTTVEQTRTRTITSSDTSTGNWYDPLAQSIMVDREGGIFATSVDIFFSHKDDELPVWVEIRSMKNGYPSDEILPFSKKYLTPAQINTNTVDGTTPTTFTFDSPVYLSNLTEYCIVVASETPEYRIWISRLGEIDVAGNRAISTQPTLGSLFKSQNASTWTASQYEDMKFTLRRASFNTGSTGLFSIVNETFTEKDSSTDKGNGLIPKLSSNPIEAVSGQAKVKVNLINHGMHDTDNNVEIKGVISDINPTKLNGAITNASTTIICDDISNFPTSGTVRIDNELITYTGVSGTTTLTGCTRGTVNGDGTNTTAAAHDDDSIVYLYMFAGIPLIEINKVHNAIQSPELDSFIVATTASATTTTRGGGENVYSTKNVSYDVIQPAIQVMELPSTSITGNIQTTSGTSLNSTQNSFTRLSTTNAIDLPLNEDYYFTSPKLICSPINESEELNGNKSLRMTISLTSDKENVSPVVDAQRMVAVAVSNRVNQIDSSADVNTTFTNYNPMTSAKGDNNAAIYITKKVTLANSGTALKVMFDAVNMAGADIRVLYKIQRLDSDENFDDIEWNYFTGYTDLADGLSELSVPVSKNIDDFKEYTYLAGKKVNGLGDPLDEFNAFAIKIVMQSSNSSYPPLIKDFRAIALAT